MMNEYLANIRFIKMYSWEKPLSKFIASMLVFSHVISMLAEKVLKF